MGAECGFGVIFVDFGDILWFWWFVESSILASAGRVDMCLATGELIA